MKKYIIWLAVAMIGMGCDPGKQDAPMTYQSESISWAKHPEWVKDAVIYEVNLRQYTPEGTFQAFEQHIPRLKELGVDILWLMPIHPIGEINRKGTLGSYYAVKDYLDVNPEFGTKEDFQHLVDAIHAAGMKVIIDWVGNHTAWDHVLTTAHPEWYLHNKKGEFIPPVGWDWSDVIVLDYQQSGLRQYMTDAMTYWVKEFDIDGYRCDVAGYVPVDFWKDTRTSLDQIKPVFMLAEWEDRVMNLAFDMTYAWELEVIMKGAFAGKQNAAALHAYIAKQINSTAISEIKMNHTSNHDKNSWEGTVFERLGKSAEMNAVLTYLMEGMPLIYSGQEVGLTHRLAFFEKDQISWGDHPFNSLYSRLNKLKKDNPALWNGQWGSRMYPIATDKPEQINVLYREKDGNRVLAFFNHSAEPANFQLQEDFYQGDYKSFKSRSAVTLTAGETYTVGPWGYEIYTYKP